MSRTWAAIRADYRRYRCAGGGAVATVFLTQGFWASCLYRVARRWRRVPVLGGASVVLTKWGEIVTGVSLPAACEIGSGLYVGHFGPTVVNSRAKIGSHCNLSQGVTLGLAGRGENRGAPILGDRVYVGANAVLAGAITIGDDVAIGAGAVVTKSVPARAIVVGNPARVISYRGSFDFVRYDGMESDPARQESLAARDAEENSESETPFAL